MKIFKIIVLLILALNFSCNNQKQKKIDKLKIWEDLQIAAKDKKIDYLLTISNDILDCIECNDGESRIRKEDFFENHINQIIQSKEGYSVYIEEYVEKEGYDKIYRIGYTERGNNGRGEISSTVYTILEGKRGIQFQGVIGIP